MWKVHIEACKLLLFKSVTKRLKVASKQGVTVVVTMQILCFNFTFIVSATLETTDVSCTPSSSRKILGRRQRSDKEDCGQKKPHTTPQPSAGQLA